MAKAQLEGLKAEDVKAVIKNTVDIMDKEARSVLQGDKETASFMAAYLRAIRYRDNPNSPIDSFFQKNPEWISCERNAKETKDWLVNYIEKSGFTMVADEALKEHGLRYDEICAQHTVF